MAAHNHVENPIEYALEKASWALRDIGRAITAPPRQHAPDAPIEVRPITPQDLGEALRAGLADLGASRADVVFIALIYPLAGLVLARMAFSYDMLPLIFPLASGFAILGPVAAVGLYEISRRREAGEPLTAQAGLDVLRSPALGSILGLGAILVLLFLAWVAAAWAIYALTLGPAPPTSLGGFMHDVFQTSAGWTMIIVGCAVGALFAGAAFALSVVSFPLLLDRDVGMGSAMGASWRAVRKNPQTMFMWAALVAGALVLGSIPALVGLIFVVPLLGHATWHLYRRTVE
ncbi:MAG: cytochrome c oxidase subunit [Phenylobacterium sp.]|nr:cytochrome c oxidase subunit [Phenylobacterium sp.]